MTPEYDYTNIIETLEDIRIDTEIEHITMKVQTTDGQLIVIECTMHDDKVLH